MLSPNSGVSFAQIPRCVADPGAVSTQIVRPKLHRHTFHFKTAAVTQKPAESAKILSPSKTCVRVGGHILPLKEQPAGNNKGARSLAATATERPKVRALACWERESVCENRQSDEPARGARFAV